MCEKCKEIDVKLEQYRRLLDPALDPRTALGMRLAIEALIAEKAALHPAIDPKRP